MLDADSLGHAVCIFLHLPRFLDDFLERLPQRRIGRVRRRVKAAVGAGERMMIQRLQRTLQAMKQLHIEGRDARRASCSRGGRGTASPTTSAGFAPSGSSRHRRSAPARCRCCCARRRSSRCCRRRSSSSCCSRRRCCRSHPHRQSHRRPGEQSRRQQSTEHTPVCLTAAAAAAGRAGRHGSGRRGSEGVEREEGAAARRSESAIAHQSGGSDARKERCKEMRSGERGGTNDEMEG